jgi:hypothetical protein
MTLQGTVVNGVIMLDGNPPLPEGARVRVELADDENDLRDPGLEPGTREEELTILRQSIEDMKAGRGRPAREVLKEIALKYNLPLQPGE